jgi:precorrin-2 dehydrogenase/sirohydrochlorin ferrochelatase
VPVDGPQYPVNLVVAGRRCLVVGAGRIAARKAEGLLACGADVHLVAPDVGDEAAALEADGVVTIRRRAFEPADLDGAWLATTATGDPAVDGAVSAAAEARRIWVNAADDPDHCSFTLPAVVRQGPVMVTVATGGHSPALATWLKRHIADELGPEFAVLAALLAAAREQVRESGRSTEGLDWLSAIDSGMLELIRRGEVPLAKERLQAWLSSSSE